jgi:hypothetical protein
MTELIKKRTTFPSEVSRVSSKAVFALERQGFFTSEFNQAEEAKSLFYDRFSESLLSKFINGEDIEWENDEYERVFSVASVEQAVYELECEGKVHRFDDVVVLAFK